jgi:hypothetical protein
MVGGSRSDNTYRPIAPSVVLCLYNTQAKQALNAAFTIQEHCPVVHFIVSLRICFEECFAYPQSIVLLRHSYVRPN